MIQIPSLRAKDVCGRITAEIGKIIVGQDDIVLLLVASLFSRGRCQLIGVPKTSRFLTIANLIFASLRRRRERLGLGKSAGNGELGIKSLSTQFRSAATSAPGR
jgi:hypothetical protein